MAATASLFLFLHPLNKSYERNKVGLLSPNRKFYATSLPRHAARSVRIRTLGTWTGRRAGVTGSVAPFATHFNFGVSKRQLLTRIGVGLYAKSRLHRILVTTGTDTDDNNGTDSILPPRLEFRDLEYMC